MGFHGVLADEQLCGHGPARLAQSKEHQDLALALGEVERGRCVHQGLAVGPLARRHAEVRVGALRQRVRNDEEHVHGHQRHNEQGVAVILEEGKRAGGRSRRGELGKRLQEEEQRERGEPLGR